MTDRPAQIRDFYAKHGAEFDRQRGRSLMEAPYLERVAAHLPMGGHVLDLGCGGGDPVARWFIERGYTVTGVDAEPTLLALAIARFPEQTWLVGDMRTVDLGMAVDALVAWDSFFHLNHDDQRAMFARFATHVRKGGALLFTSGPAHGVAINPLFGTPLFHASLAPDEYLRLLDAHGFAVLDHVVEDPACGGHTIWLAKRG